MKKTYLLCSLIVCLFLVSGCAPLLIGAAVGTVGGYAASKDTIQGDTDKSYQGVWDAAIRVCKIKGTVKQEDELKGSIDVLAYSSRVWVRLIRITQSTTRLKVAARKNHLPDLTTAQDIFTKILEEAK